MPASAEPSVESSASICEFWFGTQAEDRLVAAERAKLWWAKDAAVDAVIRQRFAEWVDKAAHGELDGWLATPAGRLALILLTDQFPRNIHRDSAQAFACDALACAWCRDGLVDGAHLALRPIERVFFYLPLEHSERLEDQERSLALFQELAQDMAGEDRPVFDGFVNFAVRHRDIIERFGRFPHRNCILGRLSTPEEVAFLQQPGSSF